MNSPIDDIPGALRAQRQKRRWSQSVLARRAGVGLPYVSDLERGKVDPRLSTLRDVARGLDLELVLVPKAIVPAVRALAAHDPTDEGDTDAGRSAAGRYFLNASEDD